ncbi:MAG: hypothetical protein N3E40_04955, partial [Dehalococcoidia bacterium]|nr:hypothetical protein [Dehalococcoidia bacterium]
ALAPVTDERARVMAVLRYDLDVNDWNSIVARARLVPITLVMVLALIVTYFMMDRARLREMKQEADRYQTSLVSLAEVDTADLKTALE